MSGRSHWLEGTLPEGTPLRVRRYQRTVPLSEIVVEDAVREACTACPQHGRQFSCPPYSPTLAQHVGDATHATVVCLHLPLAHLDEHDPALRQRLGFRHGQLLLAEELLSARARGLAAAGCGACPSCPTCSAADGEDACRTPARRLYSLESLGVNVVDLLGRCFGVRLEWGGPDAEVTSVHAVGAVFGKGGGGWSARPHGCAAMPSRIM